MSSVSLPLPINIGNDFELFNHVISNPYLYREDMWEKADEDTEQVDKESLTMSMSTHTDTISSGVEDLKRTSILHNISATPKPSWMMQVLQSPNFRRSCLDWCSRKASHAGLHLLLFLKLRWRYLLPFTLVLLLVYLTIVHLALYVAGAAIFVSTKEFELTLDKVGEINAFHQDLQDAPTSLACFIQAYRYELTSHSSNWVHFMSFKDMKENYHARCSHLQLGAFFKLKPKTESSLYQIEAEALYSTFNKEGKLLSVASTMRAIQRCLRDKASKKTPVELTIYISPAPQEKCGKAKFFAKHHHVYLTLLAAIIGLASIALGAVFGFDKIDCHVSGFEHMRSQVRDEVILPLAVSFGVDLSFYLVAVFILWGLQFVLNQAVRIPFTLVLFTYGISAVHLVHFIHHFFKRKLAFFLVLIFLQAPFDVLMFLLLKILDTPPALDIMVKLLSPTYNLMIIVRQDFLRSEWPKFCPWATAEECEMSNVRKACPGICPGHSRSCFWADKEREEIVTTIHLIQGIAAVFLTLMVADQNVSIMRIVRSSQRESPPYLGDTENSSFSKGSKVYGELAVVGISKIPPPKSASADAESLEKVTFTITDGECLAILGKKNSGNSLLVQLLVSKVQPSEGTISLSVSGLSVRNPSFQPMCYCSRENWLQDYLTGRETLTFLVRFWKPQADYLSRVKSMLYDLDLVGDADELVADLSQSAKRRFHIACVCIVKPKLLIMDHPTEGLNWLQKIIVWNKLFHMRSMGQMQVVATDCAEECSIVGTSYLVMRKGEVALHSQDHLFGEFLTGLYVYVWLAVDDDGQDKSLAPVIKEIQCSFLQGLYATVEDARESYVIFPFVQATDELEAAKIFSVFESLKDRSFIRRYQIQATIPKNVLEAFQEEWQNY